MQSFNTLILYTVGPGLDIGQSDSVTQKLSHQMTDLGSHAPLHQTVTSTSVHSVKSTRAPGKSAIRIYN